MNNFRGDLTDISAKKEALLVWYPIYQTQEVNDCFTLFRKPSGPS